ncbi:hypothetical protein Cgig2_004154 [Carnegiea gigantea]|uniref:1-deoxy-D-xylulose-5-phosphate reductoisomerase n=1 Tax=Carnegiea gigantea TaxID=171969 RepID=A0A9Q1QP88_9CARY|nr:hypothetical protein Cgig2_004154 [Carnegiea gigantea]
MGTNFSNQIPSGDQAIDYNWFTLGSTDERVVSVIMVGGPIKGTRFRPLSLNIPEPLFPLAGQPMVHHPISACKRIPNLAQIYLVGFYEEREFAALYASSISNEFRVPVRYLREDKPHGSAGGCTIYGIQSWKIARFQQSLPASLAKGDYNAKLGITILDIRNCCRALGEVQSCGSRCWSNVTLLTDRVAHHPEAKQVVTGIVGCAGLRPTLAAIEASKDLALANKETLIAGGPVVLPLAKKHNIKILLADSEHSAVFQCIQGLTEGSLRRLILTASGGSFRDWPVEKLKEVTVAEALNHPNWSLGKKVTVDSATMFNKDSSVIGQLGWPDMRIPLLYTLSWPDRIYCSEVTWPRLDLAKLGKMTFRLPDKQKYPSIDLGYAAGRAGGTMTGVISAANEKADKLPRHLQGGGEDLRQASERAGEIAHTR